MKNRTVIFLVGFLFTIPLAITSYVNSSFLETYLNKYYIGVVYIVASIIAIIGLLEMPRILNRLGNRSTTLLFSFTGFLSLIALSFGNKGYIIVPAIVLYFISTDMIIASLDIFIEDFSKNSNVGKFRGLYLMVINFSWIIAQTVSGSIIEKSSFHGIYLFSAGFVFLVSIVFILFLRDFKDPKYIKVPILKTLKAFIKKKNLSRIYLINLILKFFFAWMVIYTPIYLHEYLGFNWENIGFIFTIMLIPYILVDYPLGKLSDKIGEKKLLIIGFLITIIFTLAIPLITLPVIWLWALVFFGTRMGASIIEVMAESYFFKEVSERNPDEISFFRNTYPLSFVIAPLVAIPVLLLVPSFKYLFFVLGAITLLGLLITLRLKDVK